MSCIFDIRTGVWSVWTICDYYNGLWRRKFGITWRFKTHSLLSVFMRLIYYMYPLAMTSLI